MESAKKNEGKTDWAAVQRTVAQSEPPRIQDIPSHVKFLKIWGGSTVDHHYLNNTLAYLDLKMPAGRVVTGTFVQKLSDLKFHPKEMMPLTIHGCLIAQACGQKEREGAGTSLTEQMVKSLSSTNKAEGLKANAILEKAFQLLKEMTGGSTTPIGVKAVGDLAHELVKYIFDLSDEYESMETKSRLCS